MKALASDTTHNFNNLDFNDSYNLNTFQQLNIKDHNLDSDRAIPDFLVNPNKDEELNRIKERLGLLSNDDPLRLRSNNNHNNNSANLQSHSATPMQPFTAHIHPIPITDMQQIPDTYYKNYLHPYNFNKPRVQQSLVQPMNESAKRTNY